MDAPAQSTRTPRLDTLRRWRERWWLTPGRRSVGVALGLAFAIATLLLAAGWLRHPQLAWHDQESRWFAPPSATPRVLVVDIDDVSIEALRPRFGGWPLRRDVLALATDYLLDAGARAVAIDMVLADPRDGDAALARTLSARPGRVVLAASATMSPLGSAPAGLPSEAQPTGCEQQAWPGLLLPTTELAAAATAGRVGVVSMPADADGRLRSLPLIHGESGRSLPSLPLAVLLAVQDAPLSALRCANGQARLGELRLPIDAGGRVAPVFPTSATAVPKQGFAAVVRAALGAEDDTALRDAVRGRVAFIGASAALGDQALTPLGLRSGAYVLAASYAALEAGQVYRPPLPLLDLALMLLALLPALAAWMRGRLQARRDLAWCAAALAGLLAVDAAALGGLAQRTQIAWPVAMLLAFALVSQIQTRRALVDQQRHLEHEREAARAATRHKSEFLAHMSHEIRTPMSALLGSAEMLAQTELDAHQRRYVGVFQSAGAGLMDMLNDLLDLSKIEAGMLELHARPFSLVELVAFQTLLFEGRAQQKGLQLLTRLEADLPAVVLGDPLRLAQVLRNLLGNALKFTLKGQVTLAVRRVEGSADRLRFEVIDTGLGIPEHQQKAIFLPYEQGDREAAGAAGGTGLGLAISRRLVALMGGEIGVASREGKGTVFHVELDLPASQDVPQADWAHSQPVPILAPHAPLSILLADDNPQNIFLVQAYLEQDQHRIDVVHDGLSATERFRQQRYDLVLMDVQMPGMDGYRATGLLREIERELGLPATPVIAVTANVQTDDEGRSLAAGCSAHLAKPFSRAQLRRLIAQLVPDTGARAPATRIDPALAARLTGIPPAFLALEGLELIPALARMNGRTDLYLRVLHMAEPALRAWHSRFDAALALADPMPARRAAHDLKSTAANLGIVSLAQAAQALEDELKSMPPERPLPSGQLASLVGVERALAPVLAALATLPARAA